MSKNNIKNNRKFMASVHELEQEVNRLKYNSGHNFHTAVNEIVDNSINAKSKHIGIEFNKENRTVSVKDDGVGMTYQQLQEAKDFRVNKTEDGNGMCGEGIKAAGCYLHNENNPSSEISIITGNSSEKKTYKATYSREIVEKSNQKLFGFDVETLSDGFFRKGTEVTITDVQFDHQKKDPDNYDEVLATTYYPYIHNGGHIMLNNKNIKYEDPFYTDYMKGTEYYCENEYIISEKDSIKTKIVYLNNDIFWKLHEDGKLNSYDKRWSCKIKNKKTFPVERSGIFLVIGERVINPFGNPHIYEFQDAVIRNTSARIEIEISKNVAKKLGIHGNKSKDPSLNIQDELLKNLWERIGQDFRTFINKCKSNINAKKVKARTKSFNEVYKILNSDSEIKSSLLKDIKLSSAKGEIGHVEYIGENTNELKSIVTIPKYMSESKLNSKKLERTVFYAQVVKECNDILKNYEGKLHEYRPMKKFMNNLLENLTNQHKEYLNLCNSIKK